MFRPRIRLMGHHGPQFRAKADLLVGFPYRFNSSLLFTIYLCIYHSSSYYSRCCVVVVLLYFGYVVRIQSHFSNILTELWSSILKTFDPLPGGSFNNNSVILQLGSRRYPISEMDLAKQGLEPWTPFSASQQLNYYTIAAPQIFLLS